jgi:protein gp37
MDRPGAPYEGLTRYRTFMGRDCDLNPVGIDHTKHQGTDWSGEVRLVPEQLETPLRWRKPRRVFVCSMGDLFHDRVPNEYIAAVFGVMAAAPQHTFLVLTKRPARMRRWFEWVERSGSGSDLCRGGLPNGLLACAWEACLSEAGDERVTWTMPTRRVFGDSWPLPNVWCGASVETPEHLHRLDDLLRCPAAVHFLSAEPLLAELDVRPYLDDQGYESGGPQGWVPTGPGLAWVVVGGESGPGARPCDVTWIRSLVRQCRAAETPCFVKQLGTHYTDAVNGVGGYLARPPEEYGQLRWRLKHRKGADPSEWPEDLRVREMPRGADHSDRGKRTKGAT